jgi:hypothetical protein
MLENVWPPVKLEGEKTTASKTKTKTKAKMRTEHSPETELSSTKNGLQDNLGLGLSLELAGNQEQLPFRMREEPNIGSTKVNAVADVVR